MLLKRNNLEIETVENFSLLFNKWIPFLDVQIKEKRQQYRARVIDAIEKVKDNDIFRELETYKPFKEKSLIATLIKIYKENGFQILELKTGYRLAIGLGLPSFFENGITLHHVYGSPYIPGSSVKGLIRFTFLSYILGLFSFEGIKKLENLKLEVENEEITHLDDLKKLTVKGFKLLSELGKVLTESGDFEEFYRELPEEIKENSNNSKGKLQEIYNLFRELFGNKNYRGKVIFADAYATEWSFKTDIMNPHFQEYYGSNEQEREKEGLYLIGDWHNPVPIYFLTVENAKFAFPYKVQSKKMFVKEIDLNGLVKDLLKNGLTLLGIGSKKRKGYGKFE